MKKNEYLFFFSTCSRCLWHRLDGEAWPKPGSLGGCQRCSEQAVFPQILQQRPGDDPQQCYCWQGECCTSVGQFCWKLLWGVVLKGVQVHCGTRQNRNPQVLCEDCPLARCSFRMKLHDCCDSFEFWSLWRWRLNNLHVQSKFHWNYASVPLLKFSFTGQVYKRQYFILGGRF